MAAVSRPTVRCAPRETIACSCGSPAAAAVEDSKAMAWLTAGSPATSLKPVASSPPQRPASSPQTRRVRIMALPPGSVAGEAEQVTAVVHELVHVVARHQ